MSVIEGKFGTNLELVVVFFGGVMVLFLGGHLEKLIRDAASKAAPSVLKGEAALGIGKRP